MENSAIRRRLLAAIQFACVEQIIPALELPDLDADDRDLSMRVLGPLWADVSVPGTIQDSSLISMAFVWPRSEVFRYGYLRLL